MISRVHDFWDFVNKNYANKNVLVVAHDGVGRISRVIFGEKVQNGNLMELNLENAIPYVLQK